MKQRTDVTPLVVNKSQNAVDGGKCRLERVAEVMRRANTQRVTESGRYKVSLGGIKVEGARLVESHLEEG